MSMPGSMPLQAREGISSSAAPEPQPRAPRSRALLGRVFLGLCFSGIYLLLTRSDIILQARSGFSVWYPANGLAFAFMLGISPWYAPLAAVADFLSAVLFYHERMLSWTVALGPVGTIVYATAAILLRRRLRIDLDLSHRRDVVRYALVTLVAAVFSTAAGIAGLLADGSITWHQSWLSAFSWYSGDAIALVGVGPFLLIHVFPWVRRQLFDFAPGGRVRSSKTLSETTVGEAIEMVAQVIAILGGVLICLLGLWFLLFPSNIKASPMVGMQRTPIFAKHDQATKWLLPGDLQGVLIIHMPSNVEKKSIFLPFHKVVICGFYLPCNGVGLSRREQSLLSEHHLLCIKNDR